MRLVAASRWNAVSCLATFAAFAITTLGDVQTAAAADKTAPTRAEVSYGPHGHQLLDLYTPTKGDGPFPVLVWYGGLWKPAKSAPQIDRFLAEGCAVVAVQTRVMQDAIDAKIHPPISVCLLDGRRAVQFVRAHAKDWNLDPQRIAVGGGALPALFAGCTQDAANPAATDPIERESTRVVGVAAFRSQPSIDPKRMQEWVPGVAWGAPAFGVNFDVSLAERDKYAKEIAEWSPDALVNPQSAPIYFENNWGLTQPESVQRMDYLVHAPQWGLGFQKLAEKQGVECYVKYPDHPTEGYADTWDFLLKRLKATPAPAK